jgi:hypothetical protein
MEVKGRSILEGMGKGYFGLYPGRAVSMKAKGTEERRRDGKGEDRRADIVNEMGKRQLRGTETAAYGFSGFH